MVSWQHYQTPASQPSCGGAYSFKSVLNLHSLDSLKSFVSDVNADPKGSDRSGTPGSKLGSQTIQRVASDGIVLGSPAYSFT